MTEEKGWIDGAEILKSPNFDERKDDVSLIVIHATVSYTHLTLPTICSV